MMRKLLPHPMLSLMLGILWMLLVNRVALGSVIMATFLAVVIPLITAPYWRGKPRVARPLELLAYIGIVVYDVIVSGFVVAKIIVFMRPEQIKSAYITVPIDLKSPEAITLLAGTITMTPGTLTAEIAQDGSALLIHSLHAPDPDAIRDDIKSRYEARLKRIFA
jgi:multicomponent K+:H+ antiporter subunit E